MLRKLALLLVFVGFCNFAVSQQQWIQSDVRLSAAELAPQTIQLAAPVAASGPLAMAAGVPDDPADPEIASLARGLMNDPVLIYQYVRNHIVYEHYYGSKKGAVLTLIEKSGNDYDQCALLVALLKASNSSLAPNYVRGVNVIPYADFASWLGLNLDPFAGLTYAQAYAIWDYPSDPFAGIAWSDLEKKQMLVARLITANRGWPALGSNMTLNRELTLERMWVRVTIGGTVYNLDPSYKPSTASAPFNLLNGMGYTRSSLLSAAGGTTPNDYTVSGMDEAAIGTYLSGRVSALNVAIKNSATPHMSVEQMMGRRVQVEDSSTSLPASLPLAIDGATSPPMATIDDNLRSKLTLQFDPNGAGPATTVYFSDLKGKCLALAFAGNTATIYLDDEVLLTTTVSGTSVQVRTQITYPASYNTSGHSDPLLTFSKGDLTAYAWVYGFSPNGQHVRMRQKKLSDLVRTASEGGSVTFDSTGNIVLNSIPDVVLRRKIITETLNVLGVAWLHQTCLARKIAGDIYNVESMYLHAFGRVGQEQKPDGSSNGYYLDLGQIWSHNFPLNGRWDHNLQVTKVGSFFASAMEHGVIEQLQSTPGATSTIRILQLANRSTALPLKDEIFLFNNDTKAALSPILLSRGYVSTFVDKLNVEVQPDLNKKRTDRNATFLLPEHPQNEFHQWTGHGYIKSTPASNGMIISGGLSGGYGAVTAPLTSYANLNNTTTPNFFTSDLSSSGNYDPSPSFNSFTNYGLDPVDMGSGGFTLDVTDLTLGETEPRGLSLLRNYNSHRSDANPVGLGWGWTHSYDLRASVRSAPESMLGESTTFDAATTIVAAYACADVLINASTAKDWAVSALISGWAVDQMKNNAVSITLGSNSLQFIKQPDGTYQPPAKSTLSLTKESSTGDYLLTERLGSIYRFAAAESFHATKIKDFDGKELTLNYTSGRLMTVVDAFSRQLTFTYTGSRLSSVNDNGAPQRTITYLDASSSDYLTGCTDAEGKTWSYAYTNRRITETKDPQTRIIVQNDYDDEGRVIKQRSQGLADREFTLHWSGYRNTEKTPVQSPLTYGQTTTYLYDKRNRPVGKIDGEGNRSSLVYDGQDQMVRSTSARGHSTILTYDNAFNLEEVRDALGAKTKHEYDSLYRRTKTKQIDPQYPDPASPDGDTVDRLTTFEYAGTNATPRPDAVIDARNVRTEFTYKPTSHAAAGKPATVTVISTDGNYTTTLEYDAKGLPESTKTPKRGGGTEDTAFVYDARGDLTSLTDARGFTISYTYNNRRQTLTTTGPGDAPDYATAVSRVFYDDSGNQSLRVDPSGRAVQTATSATGKITEITTGMYNATPATPGLVAGDIITVATHAYDNRDWLDYTDGPLAGQRTEYTLDDAGRTERVTDALTRYLHTSYNADGQPSATSQELDASTTRTTGQLYDARGNPTVTTDGRGSTATTIINAWGERLSLLNRLSQTYKFTYYANGLPKEIITPTGKTTTRGYNGRNLLKTVQEPSGQVTTLAYDTANRVETSTDDVGTITYTYNANGQPLTVVQGAETITRTYDPYGRVKTYVDARGNVVSYSYHASGLLKSITYPGTPSLTVTYAYDAHNRLSTVTDGDRVTLFNYRTDGLLTKITRPNTSTRQLFYDLTGQLEKIEERAPNGVLHTFFRMAYDFGGRMSFRYELPKAGAIASEPLSAMTFDADNRLATWATQAVTHDADGNMTSGPLPSGTIGTYVFNARNQLTSAGGATYTYDAEGNRVSLVSGGQTTRYVLDVSGGSLPRVLVRERPVGGNVLSVYGGGTLLYDYEVNTGSVTYYHYDQIGSTVALSNASGTVTDRIAYTPYGTIYQRSGSSDTPFLYVGALGVMKDSNGLLFMRARYMNPRTARFVNADPIGFSGGMNWYAYANSNPGMFIDPSGLQTGNPYAIMGIGGPGLSGWASQQKLEYLGNGMLAAQQNGYNPALVPSAAGNAQFSHDVDQSIKGVVLGYAAIGVIATGGEAAPLLLAAAQSGSTFVGSGMSYLAGGGSAATYVAGPVSVETGAFATGVAARQVVNWATATALEIQATVAANAPWLLPATASLINGQVQNPMGSRMGPPWMELAGPNPSNFLSGLPGRSNTGGTGK